MSQGSVSPIATKQKKSSLLKKKKGFISLPERKSGFGTILHEATQWKDSERHWLKEVPVKPDAQAGLFV